MGTYQFLRRLIHRFQVFGLSGGEFTGTYSYMGGCQNYGPFLGTLNIRCRIIIGFSKGTIILTTTHIALESETRGYVRALYIQMGDCIRFHAVVWECKVQGLESVVGV